MSSGKIVLRFAVRNWWQYVIGTVCMLSSAYLSTYVPKQIGFIIDMFTQKVPRGEVLREIWMLLFIIFLSFWCLYGWHFCLTTLCRGIDRDLRQGFFEHLQKLTPDFYGKSNTGDLLTRSIVDIQGIRAFFGNYIVSLLDIIATLVIAIYFMQSSGGWRITLICSAPAPLLILLLSLRYRIYRSRIQRVQRAASDIGARVQENVTGIRVVKAFAQEKAECERFEGLSKNKWKTEMESALITGVVDCSTTLVYALTFSVFLVLGGREVVAGNMSIGEYTAFNGYLMKVLSPMSRLGGNIQAFLRCRVSMGRLDEVFYAHPSVTDDRALPELTVTEGALRVEDLTFRYPDGDHDVLSHVSFTVNPGELVSVMGPTGCGKSTLANLIDRLWETKPHQIYLDGKEIHQLPLAALRSAVAYVPQDNLLFADTVENNISFHDSRCTHGDVVACAELAAVHESILSFPDGYDTPVGERGVTLSGGQKQRIAIARAVCARPKLLLMDDSLSAVDTETEEQILSNLKNRKDRCSVLLITHRISAAMLSDRVLFLTEDGRVSGFGTHAQLLDSDPAYRHLFENASGISAERGYEHE